MKFQNNTVLRLSAYALAVGLAFGAAFALGSAVAPVTARADGEHATDGQGTGGHGDEHAADEPEGPAGAALPGLTVSEGGYTLVPQDTAFVAGNATPFAFTLTDPDGAPLMDYVPTHEKDLHLIVVGRDMAGFQHVHPVLDGSGTWSIGLDLPAAGTYRVFADFAPEGLNRTLTLGTDITVAGEFVPVPLPSPTTTSTLDGYEVTLGGAAVVGAESELTFTVSRDGQQLTDLEPYLGAFGHLVSLRVGDLAYLHTHPIDEAVAGEQGGPAVEFGTEFPTAGTYRLFLDFQHDGAVHTAEFTVSIDG